MNPGSTLRDLGDFPDPIGGPLLTQGLKAGIGEPGSVRHQADQRHKIRNARLLLEPVINKAKKNTKQAHVRIHL